MAWLSVLSSRTTVAGATSLMRRGELLGLRWEYGSRFHSLRLSYARKLVTA
jgi:hypothetical protein